MHNLKLFSVNLESVFSTLTALGIKLKLSLCFWSFASQFYSNIWIVFITTLIVSGSESRIPNGHASIKWHYYYCCIWNIKANAFWEIQGVQKRRRKSKLLLCQKNLDSRGYLGVHFDHKNGTFDYLHQILLFFTLEHEIEVFD